MITGTKAVEMSPLHQHAGQEASAKPSCFRGEFHARLNRGAAE
jgi:hypothetical protein